MIKVLIADDELKVCQLINFLVDWQALGMKVVAIVHNGVDAIIKLIIGTVTLAMIQWKLLLCTILTTGMVFLYTHFFPGDVSEESKKVSGEWESFTQIVKEQLQGLTVLKYFGHQKDFKNRIGQASEQLENQRYRYVKCKSSKSEKYPEAVCR